MNAELRRRVEVLARFTALFVLASALVGCRWFGIIATDPTDNGTGGGNGTTPPPQSKVTVTVEYNGGQTIDAANPISVLIEESGVTVATGNVTSAPGSETFDQIPVGTYDITVYLDADDDGVPEPADEPSITFTGLAVTSGTDEELLFVLDDLGTDGTRLDLALQIRYTGTRAVSASSPIRVFLQGIPQIAIIFEAEAGAVFLPDIQGSSSPVQAYLDLNNDAVPDSGEDLAATPTDLNLTGLSGRPHDASIELADL